jgi:O-antigen ligase
LNLKSTSREIACDASSDKALRSKVVTLAQAVRSAPGRPIVLFLLVVLSVALPLTWPWQRPPLAQYLSQWAAFGLWALTLLAIAVARGTRAVAPRSPGRSSLIRWFVMLVATAAITLLWHRPPPTAWLAPLATLGLATALVAGVSALDRTDRTQLLRALLLGVILAAVVNGAVVAVRVLRAGTDVRAAGLLAQPNQLATLVLWAGVAVVYLGDVWRCSRRGVVVALVLLIAVLVATQSRTGLIAACWLLAAGLWLSGRRSRHRLVTLGLAIALALAPLATVVTLAAIGVGLPESFSQRLMLWSNAGVLIADAPWLGHGFGAFNRAWTLRPFAERAPDVFDHAHNLPLHWAVEFGLPLSVVLLVGLAALFWRHRAAVATAEGRAAAALVLVVLLHSLTEHPLWFSYFLLPTAALAALAAGFSDDVGAAPTAAPTAVSGANAARRLPWALALVAAIMLGGAAVALRDYLAVARLNEAPLATEEDRAARRAEAERVRGSVFFGHLGDYAAIMLSPGEAPLAWFDRPLHHVIDERLLAAYARALAREGNLAQARFIVERAREFPAHPAWQTLPSLSVSGGVRTASQPAVR